MDLGKIEGASWQSIVISHSSTGQLLVGIGPKLENIKFEFPDYSMEEQITSFEIFNNFFCSTATTLILKTALDVKEIQEILNKFPQGISDYSQYPDLVSTNLKNENCFFILSPLRAIGTKLYNLQPTNNIQTAQLKGNCGIYRIISKYHLMCYLDPIYNILPFFYLSSI